MVVERGLAGVDGGACKGLVLAWQPGSCRDRATAADGGKARKIQRAQNARRWDSPWALTPVSSQQAPLRLRAAAVKLARDMVMTRPESMR